MEGLRRHRVELRESMSALEDALAAPATADRTRWAERVHVALVELSGDFRGHIDITEGRDGLVVLCGQVGGRSRDRGACCPDRR